MSFNLTAQEKARLADHQDALNDYAATLREAITDYNEALDAMQECATPVLKRLQMEFDKQSAAWQESEHGERIDAVLTAFSDAVRLEPVNENVLPFDDVDLTLPEDVEFPVEAPLPEMKGAQ